MIRHRQPLLAEEAELVEVAALEHYAPADHVEEPAAAQAQRVADDLGTHAATVSLAWLLSRPRVVAPVVGVSAPDQLDAVMAAPSLGLGRHELTELERASA